MLAKMIKLVLPVILALAVFTVLAHLYGRPRIVKISVSLICTAQASFCTHSPELGKRPNVPVVVAAACGSWLCKCGVRRHQQMSRRLLCVTLCISLATVILLSMSKISVALTM